MNKVLIVIMLPNNNTIKSPCPYMKFLNSLLIKKSSEIESIYAEYKGTLEKLNSLEFVTLIERIENIVEIKYSIELILFKINEGIIVCSSSKILERSNVHISKINRFNNLLQIEIDYFSESHFKYLLQSIILNKYHSYLFLKKIKSKNLSLLKSEQVLATKSYTSLKFVKNIYFFLLNSIEINIINNKKTVTYSYTQLKSIISKSNDKEFLREAKIKLLNSISCYCNIFAEIFNNVIKDRIINNNICEINNSFIYFLNKNQLSFKLYKKFYKNIKEASCLLQQYYIKKANILDVYSVSGTDYLIPVNSKEEHHFTIEEALIIVKLVLGNINDSFINIIDEMLHQGHIIFGNSVNSCKEGTKDILPIIQINFNGNQRDLFILIHELGHALSSYFNRNNSYFNSSEYFFLNESFAIFCEILLFNYLQMKEDILSFSFIEYILNLTFKEITYFSWEYEIYNEIKHSDLSPEELTNSWLRVIKDFYGDSIAFYPEQKWEWIYNSSVFDNHYIGFKNSFGTVFALLLYSKYKNDSSFFKKNLLLYLLSGKSKKLVDLLQILNINLEDEKSWIFAFKELESLIDKVNN